ncbi:MAG TPA: HAMP domain-containing protein [Anaerolineae bacterium]|nr:HAMP domain-containing protein [Anaerolineae bacterium]
MPFYWVGSWKNPHFTSPLRIEGYLFLSLHLIILAFVLYRWRNDFRRLGGRGIFLLLGLVLAAALLSNACKFHPASEDAVLVPARPDLPLLAGLPILLAASLLGAGPATLVAFTGGMVRGLFESHLILRPFEIAVFGLLVGFLIRQDYAGRLFSILRQPIVASLLAALLAWTISFWSFYVYAAGPFLYVYISSFAAATGYLPFTLLEGLIAGLIVQALLLLFPRLKPVIEAQRTPPYGYSLNRRLLFFVVPLILAFILALFYVVNVKAIQVATGQTIAQMARDAQNMAEERIPIFLLYGQATLQGLARNEDLQSESYQVRQDRLEKDGRSSAFFRQLFLLDNNLALLNIYPESPPEGLTLSSEEVASIVKIIGGEAASQRTPAYRLPTGELVISFIERLEDAATGELRGILVGRADMGESNPTMRGILAGLQPATGEGLGFVVDERGYIIAHPDPGLLLSSWTVEGSRLPSSDSFSGETYQYTDENGETRLVYHTRVLGQPWSVVIMVPYKVVMDLAVEISVPLLILLALMTLAVTALILLVISHLTRPLHTLAEASSQIAQGDLTAQVKVSGEDEVGRLGAAFEQMRVKLKESFEAIERERGRLKAILDSTTDAILVTDSRGHLMLANPAAEHAFGIKAAEVVTRPLAQAIANKPLEQLFTRPAGDREAIVEEIPLPDGRTLYASAATIADGDGRAIGRVAVMRDITALKELDAMKDVFVATVSHDLRSPLTFMRGYVTMIPTAGTLNEKQREFINKIIRGIDQMSELIDDLLDIGRIEAGVGIEMAPCEVGNLVKMVVAELSGRAEAKNLKLQLELPPTLPPIVGDKALIKRAVANLVDNAIKYTPEGSVTVRVRERDSYLVVSVSDTGIGIAPADQMRLFEKFYRIKRRDTIRIKGTGLGLAIVKSIAERHNGKAWVESKLGEGSTFHLALPKEQPGSRSEARGA